MPAHPGLGHCVSPCGRTEEPSHWATSAARVRRALEEDGHAVATAPGGEEGLALDRQLSPRTSEKPAVQLKPGPSAAAVGAKPG
jgi:hypothetical protein